MSEKQNALDVLSRISGRPKKEIDKIWQDVKDNHEKLNSCSLHRFGEIDYKPGATHECLNCGGKMRMSDIYMYTKGYVAAGLDKEDIYSCRERARDGN